MAFEGFARTCCSREPVILSSLPVSSSPAWGFLMILPHLPLLSFLLMHMAPLCSWVSLLAGSPHWEQLRRLVLEGHHVQEGRCIQVVWDSFSHEVVYVVWYFCGNCSLTWPQTFGDSSTPASRVLDLGRHELSCLVQRFYLSFWKQLASCFSVRAEL